jgi:hypothetical protein
MISAKQLKNILDSSLGSATISAFTVPTAELTATPNSYNDVDAPISVTISGTITPNDGLNITWDLKDPSNVSLATGTGKTISHLLASEPTAVGSYTYTLSIGYEDTSGNAYQTSATVLVTVTTKSLVGQLALPGDDITIAADLTPTIEATFSQLSQIQSINLFSINAVNTGKIVIVVPNIFGTLLDISDNTDSSVIGEFSMVADAANDRKIYVSNLALTPGVYRYKLVY